MSLSSILDQNTVISCERNDLAEGIAILMDSHDVGAVVVVEDELPIGMITDRDLVLKCLTKGAEGLELTAEDIMVAPVETVQEEEGIYEVIEQMHAKHIRRVCVVDQQGICVGIVSHGDVLEFLAKEFNQVIEASAPQQEKLKGEKKSA